MAAIVGYTGGNLLNAAPASADSTNLNSTNSQDGDGDKDRQNPPDMSKGGHVGKDGAKEEELTGDTAAKVKAAALAAQPNATILRLETDAEGAKYEAHMKTSDGKMITLKFDENFKVTSTEDGPAPGPHPGHHKQQN